MARTPSVPRLTRVSGISLHMQSPDHLVAEPGSALMEAGVHKPRPAYWIHSPSICWAAQRRVPDRIIRVLQPSPHTRCCNVEVPVNEIEPKQLLVQLLDSVELLAAPADEQIAWIEAKNVPISELILQYGDVYPIFCSRLCENAVIDELDIRCLESVKAAIYNLEQSPGDDLTANLDPIRQAPEWEAVRNSV